MAMPKLDLSLVIPLYNEEESIVELYDWINKVVAKQGYSYEIVFVDDGSTDRSWTIIAELSSKDPNVKAIKFRSNQGKSEALDHGFKLVSGKVVITMDADLQDSPDEIPELYRRIAEEKYDLVSGWKKKRYDPISKTIPTKLFNWATRKMSGIELHDFNCGLKAYNYDVVKSIRVQGEMHRYIPVIAKWKGFSKIGEKEVSHQARKYGTTKFGFERFINGFLDLLTLGFVTRFSKRPMHFFGTLGTLMFLIGFLGALWMGLEKLYYISQQIPARLVTDQPMFYISLVAMILGSQLFLTGFLAELISRNAPEGKDGFVEKKLNSSD